LKIIHINLSDTQGGAGRAMNRIHTGLLKAGINSQIYTINKNSNDKSVKEFNMLSCIGNKINRKILSFPKKVLKDESKGLFSFCLLPSWGLIKAINKIDADIIHLHWIQGEMLPIYALNKFNKPVVWTLHDMWPLNGGYHYFEINSKNLLSSSTNMSIKKLLENIIQNWLISLKIKYYTNNITFIAPSKWMSDCAKKSLITKNMDVKIIGNGIDTFAWKPTPKKIAKNNLGINENEFVIAFGAISSDKDPRKGYDLVVNAIENFTQNNKNLSTNLLMFGGDGNPDDFSTRVKFISFKHVNNDAKLQQIYSAADLMLVPSRQEAFGQTALESLACGTPVVSFNVGGLRDIVEHGISGYLAKPFSAESLADGINWVLDQSDSDKLYHSCRQKAHKFSLDHVANKHQQLYKKLIKSI